MKTRFLIDKVVIHGTAIQKAEVFLGRWSQKKTANGSFLNFSKKCFDGEFRTHLEGLGAVKSQTRKRFPLVFLTRSTCHSKAPHSKIDWRSCVFAAVDSWTSDDCNYVWCHFSQTSHRTRTKLSSSENRENGWRANRDHSRTKFYLSVTDVLLSSRIEALGGFSPLLAFSFNPPVRTAPSGDEFMI